MEKAPLKWAGVLEASARKTGSNSVAVIVRSAGYYGFQFLVYFNMCWK